MIIFDYIFYRVAKFFYRKDGIDATRAIGTLTFIQASILIALLLSILRIYYDLSEMSNFSKISSSVGVFIALILGVMNYKRYKGEYWRLSDQWKDNETMTQRNLRGALVIFSITIPFIIFFWMGTSGYR